MWTQTPVCGMLSVGRLDPILNNSWVDCFQILVNVMDGGDWQDRPAHWAGWSGHDRTAQFSVGLDRASAWIAPLAARGAWRFNHAAVIAAHRTGPRPAIASLP